MSPAILVTLVLAALTRAPEPEAIVGGWVVHAHSGARLAGARVWVDCGATLPRTTQWTDIDGAFVFRGLPAGACTLHAALGTDIPRVTLRIQAGERRLIDVPLDPESKTGDYWILKTMSEDDAEVDGAAGRGRAAGSARFRPGPARAR